MQSCPQVTLASSWGSIAIRTRPLTKNWEGDPEHEIKVLTERISTYARNVHKRFPTGDVVVGENDLAEQFGKHPDVIAAALNVLLGQRKVQKAPLSGYWKLTIG
jgi:hypothetical protein